MRERNYYKTLERNSLLYQRNYKLLKEVLTKQTEDLLFPEFKKIESESEYKLTVSDKIKLSDFFQKVHSSACQYDSIYIHLDKNEFIEFKISPTRICIDVVYLDIINL